MLLYYKRVYFWSLRLVLTAIETCRIMCLNGAMLFVTEYFL